MAETSGFKALALALVLDLKPQWEQQRRSRDSSNQTTFLAQDVPQKQGKYNCRLQIKNTTN